MKKHLAHLFVASFVAAAAAASSSVHADFDLHGSVGYQNENHKISLTPFDGSRSLKDTELHFKNNQLIKFSLGTSVLLQDQFVFDLDFGFGKGLNKKNLKNTYRVQSMPTGAIETTEENKSNRKRMSLVEGEVKLGYKIVEDTYNLIPRIGFQAVRRDLGRFGIAGSKRSKITMNSYSPLIGIGLETTLCDTKVRASVDYLYDIGKTTISEEASLGQVAIPHKIKQRAHAVRLGVGADWNLSEVTSISFDVTGKFSNGTKKIKKDAVDLQAPYLALKNYKTRVRTRSSVCQVLLGVTHIF